MPEWVPTVVAQLWSFVAVALAVYALGSTSKRIADRFGWRKYRRRDVAKMIAASKATYRDAPEMIEPSSGDIPLPSDASWYDITLRLHPLIGGALFGLLPLPTLHVIDEIAKDPEAGPYAFLAARCAWFMLAGALSGQVYEAIKFAFTEGRARLLALIGRSPPPPPPPSFGPPPTITPPTPLDVDDGDASSNDR